MEVSRFTNRNSTFQISYHGNFVSFIYSLILTQLPDERRRSYADRYLYRSNSSFGSCTNRGPNNSQRSMFGTFCSTPFMSHLHVISLSFCNGRLRRRGYRALRVGNARAGLWQGNGIPEVLFHIQHLFLIPTKTNRANHTRYGPCDPLMLGWSMKSPSIHCLSSNINRFLWYWCKRATQSSFLSFFPKCFTTSAILRILWWPGLYSLNSDSPRVRLSAFKVSPKLKIEHSIIQRFGRKVSFVRCTRSSRNSELPVIDSRWKYGISGRTSKRKCSSRDHQNLKTSILHTERRIRSIRSCLSTVCSVVLNSKRFNDGTVRCWRNLLDSLPGAAVRIREFRVQIL